MLQQNQISAHTKRAAPDSYEEVQQPPLKSMRVAAEWLALKKAREQEEVVYGEPHLDMGVFEGKHCCSCGKRYTRQFRLRQHIEVHSGNAKYPCLMCNMIFGREHSLRRHDNTQYNGKKIACPGCEKLFRPDYLPRHLAGSQNAKCRVIAEATPLQANDETEIDTRLPAESYWVQSTAGKSEQTRFENGILKTI